MSGSTSSNVLTKQNRLHNYSDLQIKTFTFTNKNVKKTTSFFRLISLIGTYVCVLRIRG